MPALDVRRIQQFDVLRILGFYQELFKDILPLLGKEREEQKLREEISKIEKAAIQNKGFVALSAGAPQGYLLYDFNFRIQQLYVNKFFRGQHFGSALVREVAKEALDSNSWLTLKLPQRTHPDYKNTRKFYKNLGFEFVTGDGYFLDEMFMNTENIRRLLHKPFEMPRNNSGFSDEDLVYFSSPSRIAVSICEACKDFCF